MPRCCAGAQAFYKHFWAPNLAPGCGRKTFATCARRWRNAPARTSSHPRPILRHCRISAATWLESAIRIDLTGSPLASLAFDDFVREARLVIEPVDEPQVRLARAAYRAFGRGSGHPAGLNFGDCFSYALSKLRDEPLLFKGRDFPETDVRPALTGASGV